MTVPMRSSWSTFETQAEYFQPMALCSCLFSAGSVFYFNLNRLLTRIFRTQHYSHLVCFGAPESIVIQCTNGPPPGTNDVAFFNLAADMQQTLRDYHRWIQVQYQRDEESHLRWEYDGNAVNYFSFWFHKTNLCPRPDLSEEDAYRRDPKTDEEKNTHEAKLAEKLNCLIPAYRLCHCEKANLPLPYVRKCFPPNPKSSCIRVKQRLPPPPPSFVRIHDLTIAHWAALKNVRTIAAIRRLMLCYEALETQRIELRENVFNKLINDYKGGKKGRYDIEAIKKCQKALASLEKKKRELQEWKERKKEILKKAAPGYFNEEGWKEEKVSKAIALYKRKRQFYAWLVCMKLDAFTQRFWQLVPYEELIKQAKKDHFDTKEAELEEAAGPDAYKVELSYRNEANREEKKEEKDEPPPRCRDLVAMHVLIRLLKKYRYWRQTSVDIDDHLKRRPTIAKMNEYLQKHGPTALPPFLDYGTKEAKEVKILMMSAQMIASDKSTRIVKK